MASLFERLRDWLSCPNHWHHSWRSNNYATGMKKDFWGDLRTVGQWGSRCQHCGEIRFHTYGKPRPIKKLTHVRK